MRPQPNHHSAISLQGKIITLWTVFLLGLLFHTQLGLMPLFHGRSVAELAADPSADISWILWLMLGFFVLPMGAIAATALTDVYRYRAIHFGLTVIYSVLNLSHLIADLFVQPVAWYQITLMGLLLLIGIVLNIVAFQWMQVGKKKQEKLTLSPP